MKLSFFSKKTPTPCNVLGGLCIYTDKDPLKIKTNYEKNFDTYRFGYRICGGIALGVAHTREKRKGREG